MAANGQKNTKPSFTDQSPFKRFDALFPLMTGDTIRFQYSTKIHRAKFLTGKLIVKDWASVLDTFVRAGLDTQGRYAVGKINLNDTMCAYMVRFWGTWHDTKISLFVYDKRLNLFIQHIELAGYTENGKLETYRKCYYISAQKTAYISILYYQDDVLTEESNYYYQWQGALHKFVKYAKPQR
jgi:hypothetical protein